MFKLTNCYRIKNNRRYNTCPKYNYTVKYTPGHDATQSTQMRTAQYIRILSR